MNMDNRISKSNNNNNNNRNKNIPWFNPPFCKIFNLNTGKYF